LRQGFELPQQCGERPLLADLRCQVERGISRVGPDQRQQLGDQRPIFRRRRDLRQQCVELVELRRLRLIRREAGGIFEVADDRIEGAVGVMRRAEIAQAHVRRTRQFLEQRGGQAGLADAGLARDQDDLPFAACRLIPTPAQQLDFLRAAD
jgi:hypothetical protein